MLYEDIFELQFALIYIIMCMLCFPIVYVLLFMFYNRFINQLVSISRFRN